MGVKSVSVDDPTLNFTNPCGRNNGDCEHLCLYKPDGFICACASGK